MRDLCGLVRESFGDRFAGQIALLEAAAAYRAAGRDPAVLETVDPDIATALLRVFGPRNGKK